MNARARAAAAIAQVVKDSPTVSMVHVPAPMGETPKKKPRRKPRRPELAKAISKAVGADDGIYVGRIVVNSDALDAWWKKVRVDGEPESLDPFPHVTVAFSRVEISVDG